MSPGLGLRWRGGAERRPGRRSGGIPNLLLSTLRLFHGTGLLLSLRQEAGTPLASMAFMGFGPAGAPILARPPTPPLVDLKIYQ